MNITRYFPHRLEKNKTNTVIYKTCTAENELCPDTDKVETLIITQKLHQSQPMLDAECTKIVHYRLFFFFFVMLQIAMYVLLYIVT